MQVLALQLPHALVMAECPALKGEMSERLGNRRPLVVDASLVEDIDFAGIQLLVAAHNSARASGIPFQLVAKDGTALAAAFARAGVSDLEILPL